MIWLTHCKQVVKDVVLTINQAIEPVEKGMTKIQESIQHISVGSDDNKEGTKLEVEEHVEKELTRSGSYVLELRGKGNYLELPVE